MGDRYIFTNLVILGISVFMVGETETFQRYCGKTLTETMKAICQSGFHQRSLKREITFNDSFSKPIENLESTLSRNALNVIFSKLHNNMMLTEVRRRRSQRQHRSSNGIYYECCLKPCTTTEMIAYCLE